jgi:hypothetical protein
MRFRPNKYIVEGISLNMSTELHIKVLRNLIYGAI